MDIRLIVKVPRASRTGHDSWQDTTYYKTFDVEAPAELEAVLLDTSDAEIIGADFDRLAPKEV